MKRLVLFVEGYGDVQAMPALVGKLIAQLPADLQGHLFLDNAPMRIGGIPGISGKKKAELARRLGAAAKRPKLGAVLLVLDGDAAQVEGQPFCAAEVARVLAERAASAGAGSIFSFAAVFLRQEYESLLLAVGDQMPGLKSGVVLPSSPEERPRDAKGWLHTNLAEGYNPTDRQLELTRAVKDWTCVQELRSFKRLQHAVTELAQAVAADKHVTSPRRKS